MRFGPLDAHAEIARVAKNGAARQRVAGQRGHSRHGQRQDALDACGCPMSSTLSARARVWSKASPLTFAEARQHCRGALARLFHVFNPEQITVGNGPISNAVSAHKQMSRT